MIPILNSRGEETGQFKKTLADELLKDYTTELAIHIFDKVVPVWSFIERYHRVITKKGKNVPFELNPAQIDLYKELCEQRREHRPMRVNILKARQLGFSTFMASVIFTLTIFAPNQSASIIADTGEHATNLFKKYKFLYQVMPQWIKSKLPLISSNARELSVDYGLGQTSSIRILVQGENAGRSTTCQYLHLSEVAFWDDIENTLTAVQQTIDETNLNTLIVYETTANGFNEYKTIYDKDTYGYGKYGESGSPFKALFYAWYYDPTYVIDDNSVKMIKIDEKWNSMMEKYHLTKNQMGWYLLKLQGFRNNIEKMKQEFPSNPVEAFITSGNSVFPQELTNKRKSELVNSVYKVGYFSYNKQYSIDGKRIQISNIKWVDDNQNGTIKIFIEPKERHPYLANNDPALGGEDYYATQVFDNYTCEQVAVFHSRKCDADECAFQLYCLAKYYNNALVSGETNTTSYILELVSMCGHTKIYKDQDVEDLGGRYMNKFGYKTKINNRQYQIDLFKEAFRDNPNIINDYETLVEMENFQIVKNGANKEKAQATGGFHDDLVMSVCGFFLCRHAQSCVPNQEVKNNNIELTEEYWIKHLKEIKQNNNVVRKGDFIQWD